MSEDTVTTNETTEVEHHHELPFWRRYIFSTDHKVIGLQYGITGGFFLLFGFCLMMLMRWSMAYPDQAVPFLGFLFGDSGGAITPDNYNTLGAMHGTIMVFMGVVPLAVGAFANYVLPLQIGAVDMAFPKLNAASYWCLFVGSVIMAASFFLPEGAAKSGWTSYPPLADIDLGHGQTFWLFGMVFLITSSLLSAINFIVTTIQLRAEGMTYMRLPFFVWAQFVTAFLLLLAFPPLEAAAFLMLMDRLADTSFFLPTGLVVSGQVAEIAGGGSPVLWQHLFWFLAHPEVYVLILPGFAIVTEVITANSRKPLWGYKSIVYSLIFLGFLSFSVWAHHMFITGMGTTMNAFFQTTTMIISIPSVVILSCLFITLWGGSIRFNTPMLFALGFLPMFGIGGLTGLPLGLSSADIHLHDTYYVIGHFHYVVAPGTLFALFAGIYHWFPKITGRRMNELLGKVHFFGSLICMNLVFFPMMIQGLAGINRRLYDGGAAYADQAAVLDPGFYSHAANLLGLNKLMSQSAWILGLFQIVFLVNLIWSIKRGAKVDRNPWRATTLEWATPSPPGHGNFEAPVAAYSGPYEYSVPGASSDFSPQFEKDSTSQRP